MEITQAKAGNFIKGVRKDAIKDEVLAQNNPNKEVLDTSGKSEKQPASVKTDLQKEHYDAGWVTGTKNGAMKALTKVFDILKDFPEALERMPVVDFQPKPKALKKVQLNAAMDGFKKALMEAGYTEEQLDAIVKKAQAEAEEKLAAKAQQA